MYFKSSHYFYFPVGDIPTGSELYRLVSSPACDNLECTRKPGIMTQNGIKVLVAEDDRDISEILCYHLTLNGYEVFTAYDGSSTVNTARKIKPHLIILDVMMPRKSGLEVCALLRKAPSFSDTYILMLTALSDDDTHIRGLESGADDFITKPVSPKVLMSRVGALLRRNTVNDDKALVIGSISIHPESYETYVDGREITLAKKEFELLHLLASRPGKVFLRNEILNRVWGNDVVVGDRTIDVHIRKIRQKLDIDCIATIKGVGYKFLLN